MEVAVLVNIPFSFPRPHGYRASTHFLEMLVLLIASKPIHSTFALSQALHAGSFPSHFCFLDRHLVQELIALATLYWVSSGWAGVVAVLLFEEGARLFPGREAGVAGEMKELREGGEEGYGA
jgi:hypothetical protein